MQRARARQMYTKQVKVRTTDERYHFCKVEKCSAR